MILAEEKPEVIAGSCQSPRYPEVLRQDGFDGYVVAEFIIDTTGHAEPLSLKAIVSNHPDFTAAAFEAVRSCRFRPGRIGGRPVRVRVQQPVNFQINR
jgi:protein TonB